MSTERLEVATEFLTRNDAAKRLKVTTRTVDRYIADGKLPAVVLPVGRRVRIPSKAVDSLLKPLARSESHN